MDGDGECTVSGYQGGNQGDLDTYEDRHGCWDAAGVPENVGHAVVDNRMGMFRRAPMSGPAVDADPPSVLLKAGVANELVRVTPCHLSPDSVNCFEYQIQRLVGADMVGPNRYALGSSPWCSAFFVQYGKIQVEC